MSELLTKIFDEIISKEDDTTLMDKEISDCIEKYLVQYDNVLNEHELERLRDCVYYAIMLSEREAFYLGMKYTLKIVLPMLIDL